MCRQGVHYVILGMWSLKSRDGSRYEIEWIDLHPGRDGQQHPGRHDTAIIVLAANITFTSNIASACLAEETEEVKVNEKVINEKIHMKILLFFPGSSLWLG